MSKLSTAQMRAIVKSKEAGLYVAEYLANQLRLLYVAPQPFLEENATTEQMESYNTAVDDYNNQIIREEAFVHSYKPRIEDSRSVEKLIFAQALASMEWWPASIEKVTAPDELWQALISQKSEENQKVLVDLIIDDMKNKKLNPPQKVEIPGA